jgi:hypothetical protein
MDKAKDQLIALSIIILVSVAAAHAQRNRDLKDAADDVQRPAEPCDLNSKTC